MKKYNIYSESAKKSFHKIKQKYKNIIAITGHRPPELLGYSIEAHQKLTAFISHYLKFMDADLLVWGGAQGADQSAAEGAISLNIPHLLAIPFQSFGSNWFDKSLFNRLKKSAVETVVVCDGDYTNRKYFSRNEFMCDLSSEVIAIYNPENKESGTAQCVRYAIETGKPVINLWDDFKKQFIETAQ